MRSLLGVAIKPSRHGLGLFAWRDIPANARIADYFGEGLSTEQLNQRYGVHRTAPYGLETGPGRFVDAACVRATAAYANHEKESRANARFVAARNGPHYIKAKQRIKKGKEIKISYGPRYGMKEHGVSHRTK